MVTVVPVFTLTDRSNISLYQVAQRFDHNFRFGLHWMHRSNIFRLRVILTFNCDLWALNFLDFTIRCSFKGLNRIENIQAYLVLESKIGTVPLAQIWHIYVVFLSFCLFVHRINLGPLHILPAVGQVLSRSVPRQSKIFGNVWGLGNIWYTDLFPLS